LPQIIDDDIKLNSIYTIDSND